jgi:hypothetical protein
MPFSSCFTGHWEICGTMMSGGTSMRGKSLWAQGKAHLFRFGETSDGQRTEAALAWLIEQQETFKKAARARSCRTLPAKSEL